MDGKSSMSIHDLDLGLQDALDFLRSLRPKTLRRYNDGMPYGASRERIDPTPETARLDRAVCAVKCAQKNLLGDGQAK